MIVSVQSARFISFNHSCRGFFLSGSGSSVKISISTFKNSDFILAIPRLYLTILIRKINSSFSLLSYIPHIWLFPPLRMDKIAIVELNRVIKSEIRNIKLHLRKKKKSQKRIETVGNVKCKML